MKPEIDPYEQRQERERRMYRWLAIGGGGAVAVVALLTLADRGKTRAVSMVQAPGAVATPAGARRAAARRPAGGSMLQSGAIDPKDIDRRLLSSSATTGGELEVSLAWNSLSDLDLSVQDPSGELTWARNAHSSTGGVQDVDANPTLLSHQDALMAEAGHPPGAGALLPIPEEFVDADKKTSAQDPGINPLSQLLGKEFGQDYGIPNLLRGGLGMFGHFSRTPVEHIYFATAPHGAYKVRVHCYSWREANQQPLPYTIQVRTRGRVLIQQAGGAGPANFIANGDGPVQACEFTLP